MKFVRTNKSGGMTQRFVFKTYARERDLFRAMLQQYPVLDLSCHQLSKKPEPARAAEQKLLEETMAEKRREHRAKLDEFLQTLPSDQQQEASIKLSGEQIEWLLQILNDVRVGTWVNLGRPDVQSSEKPELTEKNLRGFVIMELCGNFQMALLEALKDR